MTLAEFTDVFAILATQLRYVDADEVAIRAYYEALKDCPVEFVRMAAQDLSRDSQYGFPRSDVWADAVKAVTKRRVNAVYERVYARRMAGLPPLCEWCRDTGFEQVGDTNRYRPCACRQQRQQEALGNWPLPELPAAPAEGAKRVDIDKVVKRLAGKKGIE